MTDEQLLPASSYVFGHRKIEIQVVNFISVVFNEKTIFFHAFVKNSHVQNAHLNEFIGK